VISNWTNKIAQHKTNKLTQIDSRERKLKTTRRRKKKKEGEEEGEERGRRRGRCEEGTGDPF